MRVDMDRLRGRYYLGSEVGDFSGDERPCKFTVRTCDIHCVEPYADNGAQRFDVRPACLRRAFFIRRSPLSYLCDAK